MLVGVKAKAPTVEPLPATESNTNPEAKAPETKTEPEANPVKVTELEPAVKTDAPSNKVGEAYEDGGSRKTPFDTIAEDGYRGGLENVEPGTKSIHEASFTKENISKVESHLTKDQISNNGKLWENNQVMMERLKAIERGELTPTDTDKAFITHEMRESILMSEGKTYGEAHAETCKEYGINAEAEKGSPHPFYTTEAEEALYKADIKRMGL